MNEKITKKIGEACAFSAVMCHTYEAHTTVISELLGEALAADVTKQTNMQMKQLHAICSESGTTDILEPKVTKTSEKITNMGDMYVGDDWDDAAEVLEWLSFFVGGAIIHWELIAGAGATMEHTALQEVAAAGVSYYESLLAQLKVAAVAVGEARAHS